MERKPDSPTPPHPFVAERLNLGKMSDQPRHVTREDDWWVARDDDAGVASQGRTREAALENLDGAVELTREA